MIVLQGQRARLETVRFSPDGRAVYAPTWAGIQVWRPFAAAGPPARLDLRYTDGLQLTPDGRGLVTWAGGLRVLDLATGGSTEVPLWGGHGAFFGLFHAGDRLVVGQNKRDGHLMSARRLDGGKLWERPTEPWWGHPLVLPGDAEFVRVGWEGRTLRDSRFRIVTYATATGDEVRRSAPLADEVRDWVLSPDGAHAACRVTVWVHVYPVREAFTKPAASIRNDNRREFTGVAFHPSGKYLAATSNDRTVKLYDTATWQVAKTYTWDVGRVRSVAFSPDGSLAAAGSDTGKVVVWDVDG